MAIDQDLIALIDQRIRSAAAKDKAAGTCVSRDTTGSGADVAFDGSTVAMPVKVLGNVFMKPGDRCVLERFGSDWVVIGSWSALGLGECSVFGFGPGGAVSTTSASFVDFSDIAPRQFDKAFDATYVRMAVTAGCYSTAISTGVRFGIRITPLDAESAYPATDLAMNNIWFNQANIHQTNYYHYRYTVLPAGSYEIQLRWRRGAGTGTITADSADLFSVELDEAVRAGVPIL